MCSVNQISRLQDALSAVNTQISDNSVNYEYIYEVMDQLKNYFAFQNHIIKFIGNKQTKIEIYKNNNNINKVKKFINKSLKLFNESNLISIIYKAFSEKKTPTVVNERKDLLNRMQYSDQRDFIIDKALETNKNDNFLFKLLITALKFDSSSFSRIYSHLNAQGKFIKLIDFALTKLVLDEEGITRFEKDVKDISDQKELLKYILKYMFNDETTSQIMNILNKEALEFAVAKFIIFICEKNKAPLEIIPCLIQKLNFDQLSYVLTGVIINTAVVKKATRESILSDICNSVNKPRRLFVGNLILQTAKTNYPGKDLSFEYFNKILLEKDIPLPLKKNNFINFYRVFGEDAARKLLKEINDKFNPSNDFIISLCINIEISLLCIEFINSPILINQLAVDNIQKAIKKFKHSKISIEKVIRCLENINDQEVNNQYKFELTLVCLKKNQPLPKELFAFSSRHTFNVYLKKIIDFAGKEKLTALCTKLQTATDPAAALELCMTSLIPDSNLRDKLKDDAKDFAMQQKYLSLFFEVLINYSETRPDYFHLIKHSGVGAKIVSSLFFASQPLSMLLKEKLSKVKLMHDFKTVILGFVNDHLLKEAFRVIFDQIPEKDMTSEKFYKQYLLWLLPIPERHDLEFLIFDLLNNDEEYLLKGFQKTIFTKETVESYSKSHFYFTTLDEHSPIICAKALSYMLKNYSNKNTPINFESLLISSIHELMNAGLYHEAYNCIKDLKILCIPTLLTTIGIKCSIKDPELSFKIFDNYDFNASSGSDYLFNEVSKDILRFSSSKHFGKFKVDDKKGYIQQVLELYSGKKYAEDFMSRYQDRIPSAAKNDSEGIRALCYFASTSAYNLSL